MTKATHKDKHGTPYRKQGRFWLVWRNNAWWVVSGEPVEKLERIK